jgi:hypothetical protein
VRLQIDEHCRVHDGSTGHVRMHQGARRVVFGTYRGVSRKGHGGRSQLEAETVSAIDGRSTIRGVRWVEHDTRTKQYGDDDANASVPPHLAPP